MKTMMELKKLNEVLPEGWTNLFISAMTDGAWNDDPDVNPANIDFAYIYGHSGQKFTSAFVDAFLDDEGKLSAQSVTNIGTTLFQIFGESWNRLWEINKAEYDPLENYNRIEERDRDESGKEIMDRTHTGFDTSVTEGLANNNKSDNKVYGFNSSNPVNASENSQSHKSTNTFTPGVADKEEKSFNNRNTHEDISVHGNIGVLSSQQMQEQSINLWKWKFWLTVMDDMDSWLTCAVY